MIMVFVIALMFIILAIGVKSICGFRIAGKKINILEDNMNIFISNLNDKLVDIVIDDKCSYTGNSVNSIVIGQEYNKGYDFTVFKLPSGYISPVHHHGRTNEFFYMLNGCINVITKDKNCKEKTFTLCENNCFYIKRKKHHVIEAIEDSSFIMIAKPPIFRKVKRFLWGLI